MDIFESLENLNVSEECFNDIMDIVETLVGKWKEKGFPANKGAKDDMKVALYPKEIEKNLVKSEEARKKHQNLLKQKDEEGRLTANSASIFGAAFDAAAHKSKADILKQDMDDAQKRLDTQAKYRANAMLNAQMKKKNK